MRALWPDNTPTKCRPIKESPFLICGDFSFSGGFLEKITKKSSGDGPECQKLTN